MSLAKNCPECGVSLAKKDRQAHANAHWPKAERSLHEMSADVQDRYIQIVGSEEEE